ncbi:methyl-CpG-binding domain protein 3-like 2B [Callospermophilus lateralis]|uniref:methyl-CpG-binding domain protein 3-like 2B n=1 Tax=Callospermophilus lateralis TaxID=76772 RepID=UPI0040387E36
MGEPAANWFPSQTFVGKLKRNMMPPTVQRDLEVHETKAKRRAGVGSALPMRLTSCIFQSPVTRISSHPSNVVKCSQREQGLQRPRQLWEFRRLQGLQATDSGGELLSSFDFMHALQIIAMGNPGESEGPAGAGGPRPFLEPAGQPPCGRGMIPGGGLCHSPSFHGQPVTSADIRRQMWKVKKLRKKLAEALMAERLAREAEETRSPEGRSDP